MEINTQQLHRAFAISIAVERHFTLNYTAHSHAHDQSAEDEYKLQWIGHLNMINRNVLVPLGLIFNTTHTLMYITLPDLKKSPLVVFNRMFTSTNMIVLLVYTLNYIHFDDSATPVIAYSSLSCKLAAYLFCISNALFAWTYVTLTSFSRHCFQVGDLGRKRRPAADRRYNGEINSNRESLAMSTMSSRSEVASQNAAKDFSLNQAIRRDTVVARRKPRLSLRMHIIIVLVVLVAFYSYNLVFVEKLTFRDSNVSFCGVSTVNKAKEFNSLLLAMYWFDFVATFLAPILLIIYRTARIIKELTAYLKKTDRCRRNSRNEPVERKGVIMFRFVLRPVCFIVFVLPNFTIIFINYHYMMYLGTVEELDGSRCGSLLFKLLFSVFSTLELCMHSCFLIMTLLLNKSLMRAVVKFFRKT